MNKTNAKEISLAFLYSFKQLHTDNRDVGMPAKEIPIMKSVEKILQKKIKEIGL